MAKRKYDQTQAIAYFNNFIKSNGLRSDIKIQILHSGTCVRARRVFRDRTVQITTSQLDRYSAKRIRNRIKYEIAVILSIEAGSNGKDHIFKRIARELKVKTSKRNPNKFIY